jgi:hypothetical protein
MSLLGRAFLGIWHNVEPQWRDEYDAYHTIEHMPERLGIPGFLRGRRYLDYSLAPHVCFTLYEGSHSETFRSPGYLARLNAPTEWSQRVQPHMPDFVRGAFVPLVSLGEGVGGAMATYRIVSEGGDKQALAHALTVRAHEMKSLAGVCGVHVGRALTDVASAPTNESKVRGNIDQRTDDFVVLIEGISKANLVAVNDAIGTLIRDAGDVQVTSDAYPLAYSLTSNGQ